MAISDRSNAPATQTSSFSTWTIQTSRWEEKDKVSREDVLVVEEPMEIQIHGHPMAVLMRTPGHDEDLITGFLLTEGLVRDESDIRRIQTCSTVPHPEAEENVYVVTVAPDWEGWRGKERQFYASSSCGICGKGSIEAVTLQAPHIKPPLLFGPHLVQSLSKGLETGQSTFKATGGCHGAGLFDSHGAFQLIREDVGRHNAVDKVIGAALRQGISPKKMGLFVSGRVSFEIVQKAAMVGISWVGGVSAPSSLAVQTARSLGMTLVGFSRGERFTQYTPVDQPTVTKGME